MSERRFPVGSPEPDDVDAVQVETTGAVFVRQDDDNPARWLATTSCRAKYRYTWDELNAAHTEEGGVELVQVPIPGRGTASSGNRA